MKRKTTFLVAGGGITGLAFAQQVRSEDFLVSEALDDVGGYCRTVKKDGFVWDYSGHFFHFRHPEIERELVDRIGADRVRTVVRASKVEFADGWLDFPFQRNIHQLPREHFIECLVDLFDRPPGAPSNFRDMLFSKFGRAISEKFLVPYNEKLYATDLSRLDVAAMGRFFPHADVAEIIKGFRTSNSDSYNSTFTYPEGGAIEYVRAIQQDIPDDRILLNEPVIEVDVLKHIARTPSYEIEYKYLVSSMPFPRLLALSRLSYDPSLYTWNKVLVFNLGFDRKGPEAVHWIYYPQRELSFYRVGFYDNILNTGRMSLYVEVGYPSDAVLDEQEIAATGRKVIEDLKRVRLISDHKLVASHHIVLDPAYVHITEASIADAAKKKAVLGARGIYSIGRYGAWTYCSIEDNIVEARALAARFMQIT